MVKMKSFLMKAGALALCGSTVFVSGCASGDGQKVNEFSRLARPELVVPPDYKLRPPEAGLAQPREVEEVAGLSQTFGANAGLNASAVERALVKSANAVAISPVIRSRVDYEGAAIIRKSQDVTDNIRGFETDEVAQTEARADIATGGEIVTIGSVTKLPGT